jgi:archaellum biogenesis ATPase FlaH
LCDELITIDCKITVLLSGNFNDIEDFFHKIRNLENKLDVLIVTYPNQIEDEESKNKIKENLDLIAFYKEKIVK